MSMTERVRCTSYRLCLSIDSTLLAVNMQTPASFGYRMQLFPHPQSHWVLANLMQPISYFPDVDKYARISISKGSRSLPETQEDDFMSFVHD